MNAIRRLFVFPQARKRLACRIFGHPLWANAQIWNHRRGVGRAEVCVRCSALRDEVWECVTTPISKTGRGS